MNALLRLLAWALALALVVLPVVAVLNGWVGAGHWPLTRLRVSGQFDRVDTARLRATLLPYARRGFFAVDLEAAQNAVAKLPWVEHAEVRKRWPDVLEVRVVEHRPFARWGRDQLLSEHGRLFSARSVQVPRDLPQFDGPPARAADVVALYNDSRTVFAPIGLQVRRVVVDPRGSWTIGLDNGTEVLIGRSEAHARMARLVRLLPQLLAQPEQRLVRADLRYANGFALIWQEAKDAPASNGQGSSAPVAADRIALAACVMAPRVARFTTRSRSPQSIPFPRFIPLGFA